MNEVLVERPVRKLWKMGAERWVRLFRRLFILSHRGHQNYKLIGFLLLSYDFTPFRVTCIPVSTAHSCFICNLG